MTRQHATTVMAAPVEVLEGRLADVGRWPEFLTGLEAVEPAGFERYRFTLRDGRFRRTVLVCVVPHPAEHRIGWHALEGPRYLGELRLRPVDDHHTKVELTMSADPPGFMSGMRELVGERHQTAALDLQRLDMLVTSDGSAH